MYTMYPWTRRIGGLLKALSRSQGRMADAIITVTPQMAAWCAQDCGNPNVHVVPNGANLEYFHPEARSPEAPAGSYAIFFGAFSPWQGIRTMLEAVQCPEWPAGTRLVLAGDGTERPKVEAMAATDDRILYLGVKPYRELPGFVAPATVGLCVKDDGGTHSETGWSPLKLYEMMAVGIPVIVTDLPGQFEVVEQVQAGLVVKPGDAVGLAKAVARLVADPAEAKAMGQRGHDLVVSEHSWDRRGQSTLDVLQSIAKA
jgi:glycosyltransferase involved in cell wall biosynthesis